MLYLEHMLHWNARKYCPHTCSCEILPHRITWHQQPHEKKLRKIMNLLGASDTPRRLDQAATPRRRARAASADFLSPSGTSASRSSMCRMALSASSGPASASFRIVRPLMVTICARRMQHMHSFYAHNHGHVLLHH